MAVGDEAVGEVVRGDTNGYLVSDNNADFEALHATTQLCRYGNAIF